MSRKCTNKPSASKYVVAIPTYNRSDVIAQKTLDTLIRGGVSPKCIHLFVANRAQANAYKTAVPAAMYHKIVIGRLGIARQRAFISLFFPANQYVVSIDDDVEDILQMITPTRLGIMRNIDAFFCRAYDDLCREHLSIWGIYPVRNPFFMKKTITTDLRFLIGVLFGYINKGKSPANVRAVIPSILSESKEDYEQTILYYKRDGGVLRYNFITPKTKFNAPGGLGTDRLARNQAAADYLASKYPDIVTPFYRANGTPEVRLARMPRILHDACATTTSKSGHNCTTKKGAHTRTRTHKKTGNARKRTRTPRKIV